MTCMNYDVVRFTGRLGNVLFDIANAISKYDNVQYRIYNPKHYLILKQLYKYFHNVKIKLYNGNNKGRADGRQSEKIFNIPLVRHTFQFKDIPYQIGENTVGIHIRRGDYVSLNSIWRYLEPKYYEDMYFKYFNGVIPYIATDDIQWCKENIHIPNAIYIDEFTQNEVETLYILSRCKHHIGSCSTFSWWGTWINEQPGAINIYPSQWFNLDKRPLSKEETYIHNNIIPDRWIKVDY